MFLFIIYYNAAFTFIAALGNAKMSVAFKKKYNNNNKKNYIPVCGFPVAR